jgi:type VI protein secretion system component Hcp
MADHTIDAFLYFGTAAATGKAAKYSGRLPAGGVDGETSDKFATAASELKGFSWPLELHGYHFGFEVDGDWAQTDNDTRARDDIPHRPKLGLLVVRKQFDMASPKLLVAIDQVSVFDTVKLVHRRSGGILERGGSNSGFRPQSFFVATMNTVVVQALDWETRDDGVIMETVQLDYCAINVDYVPQLSKGSDDSDDKASGKAAVPFPKDKRDWTRSFAPPEQPGDGKDRGDAPSIEEVRTKTALLGRGKPG